MPTTDELYENDYSAWAKRQVALLSDRRFADLDIAHLIEELEEMGRSERNELESRLVVLLAHLLKWRCQFHLLTERWREFKGDRWRATIIEQRDRIAKRLRKSPGLRPSLDRLIVEAYADAVDLATKETGLSKERFPAACPWTLAEILDDGFFPPSAE